MLGEPDVLYTEALGSVTRLSSIARQYKGLRRWLAHISIRPRIQSRDSAPSSGLQPVFGPNAYSNRVVGAPSSRPAPLIVAGVLIGVESLAAIVFGAVALSQIGLSRAAVGGAVALLVLAYGLLLVFVARGVLRGRRWSRGPAATTQLILLPIAWTFRASPTTWVAVLIAVTAVAIIVGLVHPRSTEVFIGPRLTEPPAAE